MRMLHSASITSGLGPEWIALLGCALVLIAGFALLQIGSRSDWRLPASNARTTYRALLVSMGVCAAVAVALNVFAPGMQVFEYSAKERYIALPVSYLAFGIAVLARRHPAVRAPIPIWLLLLAAATFVSTAASLLIPRQRDSISDVAQSLLFLAGFVILGAAGLRATDWSRRLEHRLVTVFTLFALTSSLLGFDLGPYVAQAIPIAAILVYLGVRSRRLRIPAFTASAVIWVTQIIRMGDRSGTSAAMEGQIAVCAALLVVALLPRFMRVPLLAIGAIGSVAGLVLNGTVGLMLGNAGTSTDITLTHRAYETQQVFLGLSHDSVTTLLGFGPGATVDLSKSPDVATLMSSGRDVYAVDDVHLLTSWMLLKLGLIGLLWLGVLLVGIGVAAVRVMRHRRPPLLDLLLLMFVLGGLITALPAGSYLFSNPLVPLSLGMLAARHAAFRAGASPFDAARTALTAPAGLAASPAPLDEAGAILAGQDAR